MSDAHDEPDDALVDGLLAKARTKVFRPVCKCGAYREDHHNNTEPPHAFTEEKEMDAHDCERCNRTGYVNIDGIEGHCLWCPEEKEVDAVRVAEAALNKVKP